MEKIAIEMRIGNAKDGESGRDQSTNRDRKARLKGSGRESAVYKYEIILSSVRFSGSRSARIGAWKVTCFPFSAQI
jgi:hypothetical protein